MQIERITKSSEFDFVFPNRSIKVLKVLKGPKVLKDPKDPKNPKDPNDSMFKMCYTT